MTRCAGSYGRRASDRFSPPILGLESAQASEISDVRGHDYEVVDVRRRSDQRVPKRQVSTFGLEPCPLTRMPLGGTLVIGDDGQRRVPQSNEVGLDPITFSRRW